jgi:hypothetical protein
VLPSGGVFNLGDISWIIVATALVLIMVPGVGYFYGQSLILVLLILLTGFQPVCCDARMRSP